MRSSKMAKVKGNYPTVSQILSTNFDISQQFEIKVKNGTLMRGLKIDIMNNKKHWPGILGAPVKQHRYLSDIYDFKEGEKIHIPVYEITIDYEIDFTR
jgi:hypothetical protein